MKWLWITALLFLVTGVKSVPPTRKVGVVDTAITRIDRGGNGGTGLPETFQFTLEKALTGAIGSLLVLEVQQDGKSEVPESVKVTDTQQLTTPTFVADLTQYSPGEATFLITAFDESVGITAEANADIKSFPIFPTVDDVTNLVDPRPANKGILIRLTGGLGSMSLTNTVPLVTGSISYYSFLNSTPTDYIPTITVSSVVVCDVKLSDYKVDTQSVPIVDSAVLAHGPKDSATIKLTFQNNAVTHEAILIPQPSQSSQSPDENVLCTDFTRSTCNIKWSDPSSAVLQLIIIQKTTGQGANPDTWATSTFDIHDRALVATKLGTNIIEGRWNILDVDGPNNAVTPENPHYQIILSENTVSPIFVDCSHLVESKLCFGYFPNVNAGTYTLTVVPENGTALLDQIESNQVNIEPSRPELEILSRHTTTQQNQQRADVQICFQHRTPTEGRSFSHYEMLIINEKGQWLKHSLMQEEEEGGDASGERLCSAPFTINTTDFALTEATRVVVSQRAVDGISVLASGESALF